MAQPDRVNLEPRRCRCKFIEVLWTQSHFSNGLPSGAGSAERERVCEVFNLTLFVWEAQLPCHINDLVAALPKPVDSFQNWFKRLCTLRVARPELAVHGAGELRQLRGPDASENDGDAGRRQLLGERLREPDDAELRRATG